MNPMRNRIVLLIVFVALVSIPRGGLADHGDDQKHHHHDDDCDQPHQAVLPGWSPVQYDPIITPAGTFCSFNFRGDLIKNEVIFTTTKTFPNGDPQQQVYIGPLVMRATNVDTGKYKDVDIGGDGTIDYAADGSFTWTFSGKVAVGFLPGDNFPAGIWAVDGYHVIHYAPNLAFRDMQVHTGTEENLCDTLL